MTSRERNIRTSSSLRNRQSSLFKKGEKKNTSQKTPHDRTVWLWGRHAVRAALSNPRRHILTLYATKNAQRSEDSVRERACDILEARDLSKLLPPGAVHQGLAARALPLEPYDLEEICAPDQQGRPILALDMITDPHNVGALFRSAAAFGARAVIMLKRHSPPLSGGCAKAAVGAVEHVPFAQEVNLARTLESLKQYGYTIIGLDGTAPQTLTSALEDAADPHHGPVLVLGSEDKGLRPGVRSVCDHLASIPIASDMESLNVSTTGAIALYEATKSRGHST